MKSPNTTTFVLLIAFMGVCLTLIILEVVRLFRWYHRLRDGTREYVQRNNVKLNLGRECICMVWVISETLWALDPYGAMDILPQSVSSACSLIGLIFLVGFSSYMCYAWNALLKQTAAVCGATRSLTLPLVRYSLLFLIWESVVQAVAGVGMVVVFEIVLVDGMPYKTSLVFFTILCMHNAIIGLDWFVISTFILQQVMNVTDKVIAENVKKMDPLRQARKRVQAGRVATGLVGALTLVTQTMLGFQFIDMIQSNPERPDFTKPETITGLPQLMLAGHKHGHFNYGNVQPNDIVFAYFRSCFCRITIVSAYILFFWPLPSFRESDKARTSSVSLSQKNTNKDKERQRLIPSAPSAPSVPGANVV